MQTEDERYEKLQVLKNEEIAGQEAKELWVMFTKVARKLVVG